MELITLRSQIKKVAAHWKAQNYKGNKWGYGDDKKGTYQELLKLNVEVATPQDVAKIIGNTSWARPTKCGECGGYFDTVIQIGEPKDYESCTAFLCKDCIERGIKLFAELP